MSKTILIHQLSRTPRHGPEDALNFQPGLNVIVGPPNTGKTKWLRTLDFLLGDDARPEDVLGDDILAKYEMAEAKLTIANDEFNIKRRWKEPGVKTKVFLNDAEMNLKDFRQWLIRQLGLPELHYPQGNPYGPRTWPELGWRSLYRHIYRRQHFWGDLADQQPESEQHACLMQFLGIAGVLFSEQYGRVITKEKQIAELKWKKDQFVATLQEVSKDLITETELGVALTPQSIEAAVERLQREIQSLQDRRSTALNDVLQTVAGAQEMKTHEPIEVVERMSEDLAQLRVQQETCLTSLKRAQIRLAEMRDYRRSVADELTRMQRVCRAGVLFDQLKVTHCPVCDRELTQSSEHSTNCETEVCYLCKREYPETEEPTSGAIKRLEFEADRLKSELHETDHLLQTLTQEVERLEVERTKVTEDILRLKSMLQPVRTSAASMITPEISVYDMESGRLHERLQQLSRIRASLDLRTTLGGQISQLQQEVTTLQEEVSKQSNTLDFELASQRIEDGINTYLNRINAIKPRSWTQEAVSVRLGRQDFAIKVGKRDWKAQLGGTLTLYFLLSYHFALLSLTTGFDCNYPGLLILDFPAELPDGSTVADKENFVLEPFVELLTKPGMEATQVIAVGSAFENLRGANRMILNRIWR